jgi:hypothetical protein
MLPCASASTSACACITVLCLMKAARTLHIQAPMGCGASKKPSDAVSTGNPVHSSPAAGGVARQPSSAAEMMTAAALKSKRRANVVAEHTDVTEVRGRGQFPPRKNGGLRRWQQGEAVDLPFAAPPVAWGRLGPAAPRGPYDA